MFPYTFYNIDRSILTYVHVGDYVSAGKPERLRWMQQQIENKYKATINVLGLDDQHMKHVTHI